MLTLHKTAELHMRTENKTNLQLTNKLHLRIIEHNIPWLYFTKSSQQTVAITNRRQKEENALTKCGSTYGLGSGFRVRVRDTATRITPKREREHSRHIPLMDTCK